MATKKAAANTEGNSQDVGVTEGQTELEAIHLEIARVELETKRLNLDEARHQNEEHRRDSRNREQRAQDAQDQLDVQRATHAATVKQCRHKQGGFGLEQTLRGNGDYCLVAMEGPLPGHKYIICGRCGGEWRTPNPTLKKDDPKAYLAQLKEYNRIAELMLETNTMLMGSPMFEFQKDGVAFMPDRV